LANAATGKRALSRNSETNWRSVASTDGSLGGSVYLCKTSIFTDDMTNNTLLLINFLAII
jgi:hypothetical protein